ncbi:MAG: hypothetical protein HC915_08565, partial [Anaerolineae bacterium]|nr:hypothetical protein [Anaerolineae bacterium]
MAGSGLAFILLFGGAVAVHRRVQQTSANFATWRDLLKTHLARMRLDWAGIPPQNLTATPGHPFETDLDLLDLHCLLNTAFSHGGAARLHHWMLDPVLDLAVIQARQALVREVRPLACVSGSVAIACPAGQRGGGPTARRPRFAGLAC